MVNQWGRDGNSSPSSSRSSAGGIIIAALVALVIGGGGGYAGARFFSGISAGDVAVRDKKISELQQQISDIKFNSDGASTEQSVLRARIAELEGQVASLDRTKESLRKYAEDEVAKARSDAQAEIDALNKTLEEAGQSNDQLTKARRSLKVSELQLIELEQAARQQELQIEKLQTALNDRAEQGDAGLKALNDQIKGLQSALSAARKETGTIPALKKEIQDLRDQLSTGVEQADAEARKQIDALKRESDALKRDKLRLEQQLEAALKDSGNSDELDALTAQIDQIQRALNQKDRVVADQKDEIANLNSSLDAFRAKADKARADADKAKADADKARADADKAKADVAEARADADRAETDAGKNLVALLKLQATYDALTKTVKQLRAEVAEQKALIDTMSKLAKPVVEDNLRPTEVKPDPKVDIVERRRGRDVAAALERMPGFDRLSDAKKEKLQQGLEEGGCVTGPLKSVYGRVPPVALINLMRELDSSC